MKSARLIAVAVFLTFRLSQGMGEVPAEIDFVRDIQPLFKAHCIGCHGPEQQKNSFRLDRRRDAMRGGTATMIGPGNADASRLYLRLVGDEVGVQMPPDGPLAPEETKRIKAWIDRGASWPDAASGAIAPPPPDLQATRMMEILRAGDRAAFRKMLRAAPDIAKLRGESGSTPLMYAVLYGHAEDVRLLLEAGADANARNEAGATALMWAADDLDKTRLLLRAGADPNARSDDGRTPLLVATTWPQSTDVVKLLLDRGARPSPVVSSYRGPLTPLRLAAEAGNEVAVRLLLDRGAEAKAMEGVLPLVAALSLEDTHCASLLSSSAAADALKTATLFLVPPFASPSVLRQPWAVKTLIGKGGDVAARDKAGRTVLMLAVSSDHASVETIEALIELGADLNASTPEGKTVLDFARQLGESRVVKLLVQAGAKSGQQVIPPDMKPRPAASARAAVERSLPLLQRADATFLRKSGCVSCHHNSLTSMTISAARKAGMAIDEDTARSSRNEIASNIEVWRERALQGSGIPGDSNTINYLLVGLAAEDVPPDAATDALARYLKNDQLSDGAWRVIGTRPPLESSELEITAVAMRAIQAYAPQAQRADYEKAVWRAAGWLRTARPSSTADRAFQLLGLTWAGDEKETLQDAARVVGPAAR
jgi:ankyrin repeat protein